MAWPDTAMDDLARRASTARELDRQTFWKECFKLVLEKEQTAGCTQKANGIANESLRLFDDKFGANPS